MAHPLVQHMPVTLETTTDPGVAAGRRARKLFDGLVGRRTGIVRQIAFVDTMDGDAGLFHAGAQIANAHPALHAEHVGLGVGGAGRTREEAIVAALCEGVERYAPACYPPLGGPTPGDPTLRLATRRELGDGALTPAAFSRFSDRQRAERDFPFLRLTDNTPLRWVRGTDVTSGAPSLVPAFAVFMPYVNPPEEALAGVGLSTGLACAPTLDRAIDSALSEIVEREAVALCWMRGLTPARLDAAEVTRLAGDLLPPRDEITAFDITTDLGIPVVLVVAVGEGPRGRIVSVGAACHVDPMRAVRKAALEASQDRVYVRLLIERDPGWAPAADFGNLTDFSRHARVYSGRPALWERGSAFLHGGASRPLAAQTDVSPRHAFARAGVTAISVDLTPPWAATLGLAVARVVAPDLLPLHGSHAFRYLGHPRLQQGARIMPGATLQHDVPLWPYPHPMP